MKRASPHEKVSATIGGATITVEYGRPYAKGRTIFGGLVPYGKIWRTGADEATTFETSRDVMLGDLKVPAGKYTLFTIPAEKEWTIILNKVLVDAKGKPTWGAYSYEKDKAQDLGQTKATAGPAAATEQLTITIDAAGEKDGALTIKWAETEVRVPIKVL
jgi:hypothetical protein